MSTVSCNTSLLYYLLLNLRCQLHILNDMTQISNFDIDLRLQISQIYLAFKTLKSLRAVLWSTNHTFETANMNFWPDDTISYNAYSPTRGTVGPVWAYQMIIPRVTK